MSWVLGPNYFSGRYEDVWVDENGYLYNISEHDGRWYSSEVVSRDTMGYGTHTGWCRGDLLEYSGEHCIGIFTWDNNTFHKTDGNSEIDI